MCHGTVGVRCITITIIITITKQDAGEGGVVPLLAVYAELVKRRKPEGAARAAMVTDDRRAAMEAAPHTRMGLLLHCGAQGQ